MTAAAIKVAIPNKGSLALEAVQLLKAAGYKTRRDDRQLVILDEDNGIEFFYLRPKDIATYVGEGTLDFGITGKDMLLDSGSSATEVLDLKFAASKFHIAVPRNSNYQTIQELSDSRIATSLPTLLADKLSELGTKNVKIVKLDGAVESSIQLGVADAIADVVSTGTTLKQAGLRIIGDPLLHSSAILIRSQRKLDGSAQTAADLMIARLLGIQRAKEHVLLDFDLPENLIEQATQIAPGFAAPTVSPLAQPPAHADSSLKTQKWVAVRVMAQRSNLNVLMDELHSLGARAILATEIITSRI